MSYILLTWLLAPLWWPISLLRKLLDPQPKRILILEIAGIGDVVCSMHMFKQLRAQNPKARIDLAIDPVVQTLSPLLNMVDRVIVFPYAQQRGLLGRLKLAKICVSYDTAISIIPSAAQLIAFCWAAIPRRMSVIPEPVNLSYRFLCPLLTDIAKHKKGDFLLLSQAKLLRRLGVARVDLKKRIESPIATPVPAVIQNTVKPLIGLLVGSGRDLKRLKVEQLAAIATGLVRVMEHGSTVFLIGGPADKQVALAILSKLGDVKGGSVLDLTGCYPLSELPHLLKNLSVLVGVDSGVTHMANALQVPVVCIAGPVDVSEVYQESNDCAVIKASIECYPCSFVFDAPSICPAGTRACLNHLNVNEVIDAANMMVARKSGLVD
ncbi:MAG: glycosyltransferase family 9 protein [Fluviibacter sp.]